jgi:hypothetical protein
MAGQRVHRPGDHGDILDLRASSKAAVVPIRGAVRTRISARIPGLR